MTIDDTERARFTAASKSITEASMHVSLAMGSAMHSIMASHINAANATTGPKRIVQPAEVPIADLVAVARLILERELAMRPSALAIMRSSDACGACGHGRFAHDMPESTRCLQCRPESGLAGDVTASVRCACAGWKEPT